MTMARKVKPKSKIPNSKRGRLIIRNLPFTVTEEALKSHFSHFGSIKDINILKKSDGKLVGCGFVQFDRKQSAAKAIHHASGKPFMGRVIIVDWAVPKNKFSAPNKSSKQIKPGDKLLDPHDSSEESDSASEDSSVTVKMESACESEENDADSTVDKLERKRPDSHDVAEGRTVFLKNVPFNITNDELKEFMQKVGPVFYAVVCIDPLTEHSKGTAFVKFKDRHDACKCVESGIELKLKGSVMQAFPALEKKQLLNQERNRHPDKKKDNRNLYLVKEGAVIAGTRAADGVSMSDMRKRLELELWKSNMLRNLNMFVSRTRLIVHNLPASYDDKMLRELFKKHGPPRARIIEAKVMRNLRQLDQENKPVSKGYGFVSFTEHEHALAALRNVNNNPTLFNKNKRPIVAFSIENRIVHKVKQKRAEKSKVNNSLCPESKKPKLENKSDKMEARLKKRTRSENVPNFAGIEAHPGHTKLTSKNKVALQGAIHFQNIKATMKERKRKVQVREIRRDTKREPKIKSVKSSNTNFDERRFNNLVKKYKQKIPAVSVKKWYEAD